MAPPSSEPPDDLAQDLAAEAESLRGVVDFMKRERIRRIRIAGDAWEVELEPGAATLAPPTQTRTSRSREQVEDDKVEQTADAEAHRRKMAEAEHNRYWRRITRASGAPIPPFEG